MHFRTDQGVKIQKLFETLAPLLVEANIVFSSKGIHLKSLAPMLFAGFELKAANLDEYHFDADAAASIAQPRSGDGDGEDATQLIAGVNFPTLFKYFKTVTQNDAVAMQITKAGYEAAVPVLFVHIITATMTYSYRYNLLAIDEVGFEIPDQKFDTVVRVSSVAFLRALRSCEQVGDAVQIMSRATKDQKSAVVYIICEGMQSDLQVTISATDEEASDEDEPDAFSTSDKRERYSLKFLNYMAKATSLNNTVQLFLVPKYAIVVRYRVGKMGHLEFALPQKIEESDVTISDFDGSTDSSVTTAPRRKLPFEDDSHNLSDVLVHKSKRPRTSAGDHVGVSRAKPRQRKRTHQQQKQHQPQQQHHDGLLAEPDDGDEPVVSDAESADHHDDNNNNDDDDDDDEHRHF
jgi:proliferating cell nuclear antigen PCNA